MQTTEPETSMKMNPARILVAACCTYAIANAYATPFRLLRDVYPGPNGGVGEMASLDTQLFFWGYTDQYPSTGNPWTSNGSASGTAQVGNGIEGSSAHFGGAILVNNNIAYFVNDNGFDGYQWWRSDGTAPGTFELTSTVGGFDTSSMPIASIGNRVVFEAGNATQGFALMSSDGTLAATQTLSSTLYIEQCVPIAKAGNTAAEPLLCTGSSGPSTGLVATDGTSAGTTFVTIPELTGFSPYSRSIASVNEVVYFAGTDATHGTELWRSDGTAAGTMLIKDVFAGANSSTPDELTRVDDRLFFTATTPDAGRELWVSDGTDAGTVRVRDINPGLQDSSPSALTALDGVLYFIPDNDGTGNGRELWRSDGTNAGTVPALGNFNPNPGTGAFDYSYDTVQSINGKLALVMNPVGSLSAAEPYVSDGTVAGTLRMSNTQQIAAPYGLVAANGRLFAAGQNIPSSYGNELIAADAFAALGNTWCSAPEQPIPDDDTIMYSRFHLPSYGGITGLRVSVDIGHTYVGDLQVALRHVQTGTEVTLINTPLVSPSAPNSCSGALLDITFDDSAGADAEYSCTDGARPAYPWRASYRPYEPLSAFNGESVQGDWTLSIDDVGPGDAGVLHAWCIGFATDRIFGDDLE